MKALGFLGGSFDPIHNGHLLLAKDVYRQLGLEQVIFVPAFIAPHKIGQGVADSRQRLQMVQLAVQEIPYFSVSDVEIRKGGISYTVETMEIFKKLYPDQELYFIIGADSVPQLESWHKIEHLFDLVTFAAVYRPGYDAAISLALQKLGKLSQKIVLLKTPEYAVSSTLVRQRIGEGGSLAGLVQPSVAEYIKEHGLYQ